MSCAQLDGSLLVNADLFDVQWSESSLAKAVASGSPVLCPFPRYGLVVCCCVTLLLHCCLLVWVLRLLSRLWRRYGCAAASQSAARYAALVVLLAASTAIFNITRLVGLTAGLGSGEADGTTEAERRLLLLSFSPRAGASQGMNALLFVMSASSVAAVGYGVASTVRAARKTAALSQPPEQRWRGVRISSSATQEGAPVAVAREVGGQRPATAPFLVLHFDGFIQCIVAFNACVWLSVFLLPTAARSSAPGWSQLAIGLLLMSLGNLGYWLVAVSAKLATKAISSTVTVLPEPADPAVQQLVVAGLAPPSADRTSVTSQPRRAAGLTAIQTAQRNDVGVLLAQSSHIIKVLLVVNILANIAFIIATVAGGPSSPVLPFWLYFTQSYWTLLCFARMRVLKVAPAPGSDPPSSSLPRANGTNPRPGISHSSEVPAV